VIRSSNHPMRGGGETAILAVAGLMCLFALCTRPPAWAEAPAQARHDSTVGIGEPLREATLHGLNGPPRTLSEFRGKPLIINVWASWCDPCRGEMASLDRLAWLDVARSFRIIGISTDDDPEQARAWLKASHATINQFIDDRLQMEHMLGASHIPLTVLVDAHGRVREKIYGARQWDSPESLNMIRKAFAARQ
jgi:thiol-disulfide isomerase/thioredoxin